MTTQAKPRLTGVTVIDLRCAGVRRKNGRLERCGALLARQVSSPYAIECRACGERNTG